MIDGPPAVRALTRRHLVSVHHNHGQIEQSFALFARSAFEAEWIVPASRASGCVELFLIL